MQYWRLIIIITLSYYTDSKGVYSKYGNPFFVYYEFNYCGLRVMNIIISGYKFNNC